MSGKNSKISENNIIDSIYLLNKINSSSLINEFQNVFIWFDLFAPLHIFYFQIIE